MIGDIQIKGFEKYIVELKIPIIVVYYNTDDYPNKYVARLWNGNSPTSLVIIRDSFKEIEICLPATMVNVGKHESDDSVVVCSFI